jgi:glucose-1-phosphate thymidylyltransferase
MPEDQITKPKKRKMKGIILAGGTATRLFPMTATTSKQLLPVYDRQMIFYPLNTLIKAGIKNILIIVAPEHSGQFLNLLGSLFKKYGIHITFEVQSVPRGLAEALTLGENHIGDDNVALILGDNIFEDDFSKQIKEFRSGGHVFAKKVSDPERFGVVKFNKNQRAVEIVEKPNEWISDYAVTGLYLFDNNCIEIAKNIKPSERGEVEITEVNKAYLRKKKLAVTIFEGEWLDAGTPDSLLEASRIVKEKEITKNFHPVIDEAIKEFSEDLKVLSKKKLK